VNEKSLYGDIGSESYSGTKIPWPEKAVRVRFPPEVLIPIYMLLSELINDLVSKINTNGDGQVFVRLEHGLCCNPEVNCDIIEETVLNDETDKKQILNRFVRYKIKAK